MNGPIRRVAIAAMAMFTALMLNLTAGYVLRTDSLSNRPENRRVTDARFAQDRGPIMVGNSPIAVSEPVKDRFKFQRSYPSGELWAPVTGFYSYVYGSSALEASYSEQLAGVDDSQFLDRLINIATGATPKGASVETTLDADAQRAGWDGLDGRKGAVVALDTSTGAVRALVTSPSFDPNLLATHDLADSQQAWKELNADSTRPMANRATREIYPPGSTFKVVTASAALAAGMSPDTKLDATPYKLPGSSVVIKGNCGADEVTLTRALEVSCNPAFARLGVELGADALREQSERFGFGDTFLRDIGSVASKFPEEPD
ncbi:MAG: penicillin-binding transpeptidase domain-containing protein, partial [Propionicimonas sp.]